jgi:hypothetical protein
VLRHGSTTRSRRPPLAGSLGELLARKLADDWADPAKTWRVAQPRALRHALHGRYARLAKLRRQEAGARLAALTHASPGSSSASRSLDGPAVPLPHRPGLARRLLSRVLANAVDAALRPAAGEARVELRGRRRAHHGRRRLPPTPGD